MEIARRYNGEIVCADSRTVYRYMDIGTAKPTKADQAEVRHHLLDIVDPDQKLSAAEFKRLANEAIDDISARGKLPILVGGSGLYIDAVLYDFKFPPLADAKLRAELEQLTTDELVERLNAIDPSIAETVDRTNRRRLIRALETAGQPRAKGGLRSNTLLLGIDLNNDVIRQKIVRRVEVMFDDNFVSEVRMIGQRFGWESEAMTSIGYRATKDVILGRKSIAAAKADFVRGDMALVKKQRTWFRRNPDIEWAKDRSEARRLVDNFLKG
jgi:tRNA dimethylallyltransferase